MEPRLTPMIALKKLLEEKGSQKATAEHLGISAQFLSDMLKGRRQINDRIADLLGLEKTVWWEWKLNPAMPRFLEMEKLSPAAEAKRQFEEFINSSAGEKSPSSSPQPSSDEGLVTTQKESGSTSVTNEGEVNA